ncbi:hypothetical protein LINPERHAP2_LOCUS30376, partial [Linum perenne]
MDYMFGNVPEGVSVGPSDPSILWGDSDRHRAALVFDAEWDPWVGFEGHSPQSFVAYRVVTPLICYFIIMWHRPD